MSWKSILAAFCAVLTLSAARAETLPKEVTDISGRTVQIHEPGRLGAVFIFVLQDCPISNGYAPEMNRLAATYTNFNFFVVHVDSRISRADAQKHADEFQLRLPVLIDWKHELVKTAGATITPEVAVFSPQGQRLYLGRIDDTYLAPMKKRMNATKFDLREALDAIVAGKSVPNAKTKAIGCFIPEIKK